MKPLGGAPRWLLPLLAGGLLAAAVGARHSTALSQIVIASYAGGGESLLHGVHYDPFHLPAADVLAALLDNHWNLRYLTVACGFIAALAALVAAVEASLGSGAILGLTPAALVIFYRWEYPQNILSLILLTTAGFLIRYVKSPSYANALWVALSIGGSYLFRSTMAFLPPAVAIAAAFRWAPGRLPERAKHGLLLLVVPYLFTLPVLRTNYRLQHHRIIPFEDGAAGGASTNIIGAVMGMERAMDGPGQRGLIEEARSLGGGSVLVWAAKETASHPLRYAAGYLLRLGHVFRWSMPFIVFALWALWSRRRQKEYQALGLLIAYWTGIHCMMAVEDKYLQPLHVLSAVAAFSMTGRLAFANGAMPRRVSSAVLASFLAVLLAMDAYATSLLSRAGSVSLERALERAPDDWWLLDQRGTERLRRGDAEGAEADFSRALAAIPADRRTSNAGAMIEWKLAEAETLRGRPERVWTLSAGTMSARLIRAYALLDSGRRADAREEMKSAVALLVSYNLVREDERARDAILARLRTETEEDFTFLAGQALADSWPSAAALKLTALITEAYPRSVPAWVLHAEFLRKNGRHAEFESALARGAKFRSTEEDLRLLVSAHAGAGDFKRAFELLEPSAPGEPGFGRAFARLEEIARPGNPAAWRSLAAVASDAGRQDLAVHALEKAVDSVPESMELRRIIVLLDGMEQRPRVIALRKKIAGLHPAPPPPVLECALVRLKPGAPPPWALLETCALGEPGDGAGWLGWAAVALDGGRKDLAGRFIEAAAEVPLEPEFARRLAHLIGRAGDSARALALLRRLTESRPDDFRSWIARSEAEKASDPGQALRSAARAESAARGRAETRDAALCYQGLGAYSKACGLLADLSRRAPGDASLLLDKGVCAYLSGSPRDAENDFLAALKIDPALAGAALSLGMIYVQQKRGAEALRVYDRALARVPASDPARALLLKARAELSSARKTP